MRLARVSPGSAILAFAALAAVPAAADEKAEKPAERTVFPADNFWNKDISKEPVDPKSADYIRSIGADRNLHPDFGPKNVGIPYVYVPGNQPKLKVKFEYADESDPGPYPVPPNPPIEGGPDAKGDRHIIMIDKDNWVLYELFAARQVNGEWTAGSGAIFDLKTNKTRPAGWTSADAAGLAIFPGLVRADEVLERKEITHALRFTCVRTQKAYVAPASHFASNKRDASLPPMGIRVRLKADYDISRFPANVQVILRALKKYGMILADNGGNWYISGAPDDRWDNEELAAIKKIKGRDLEVIRTGPLVTR